jgi:hypothetical protein
VATVAAANRARWIAEQERPEEAEEARDVTVEAEEERLAA